MDGAGAAGAGAGDAAHGSTPDRWWTAAGRRCSPSDGHRLLHTAGGWCDAHRGGAAGRMRWSRCSQAGPQGGAAAAELRSRLERLRQKPL
ncbi:MAG: hypothetical protein ACLRIS_06545 [Flavonifractor plautii]